MDLDQFKQIILKTNFPEESKNEVLAIVDAGMVAGKLSVTQEDRIIEILDESIGISETEESFMTDMAVAVKNLRNSMENVGDAHLGQINESVEKLQSILDQNSAAPKAA